MAVKINFCKIQHISQIAQEIDLFFVDGKMDVSPIGLWEAHKRVIRGT